MRAPTILCGSVLLAAGCLASTGTPDVSHGDPEGRAALASLPDVVPEGSGDTEGTHVGMGLAGRALDDALPEPPSDRSFASLHAWVQGHVTAWIGRRKVAVDETRFQFASASEERPGEEIIGHAVVGLIHEDTAMALKDLPVPDELHNEPDVAEMYQEVIASQTVPFLSAALVEFRECANLAYVGPEDMRHWAMYCALRFRRLKSLPIYQTAYTARPVSTPASSPR